MNRRVLWIAVAAVAVVAALAALLLLTGGPAPRVGDVTPVRTMPTPTPAPEQRVVLLFLGADGMLHPELRSVPLPAEVEARILVVLEELLAGPTGDPSGRRLWPVVPYEAGVGAVFVDGRGTAFVDLSAPPAPLAGSHVELILAYGVVDSILLNCPELRAVQLLFGGREIDTLTGHLDLSRPLPLNRRFIAAS